ncbi:discoidin domain-containing protein [Clostridium cochlearium]|uniref:discoidin domain-containing protein n=1 Tax=Clostridium cochlearium TaxID=1494 RepID=UPI000BBC84BF|nr:discoidin domain-containing protein [Clostridium cochlearium]
MESIIEYIDITSLGKYTTDTGIYRNNILDNLFDNNISTIWTSNGYTGNIYIKFDSDINISKVQISHNSSEIISIYYSYNGVDYIKLSGKFLRPDLNSYNYTQYTEDFVFNNDVRTKYWKFVLSRNNGGYNYASLQELKIYSKNLPNKFLLKQNNQYYTIKPEYYSNGQFQPLTLEGGEQPNENDYEKFGSDDVNDLLKPIQVGEENFTPYDKLENEFEICMAMDKE